MPSLWRYLVPKSTECYRDVNLILWPWRYAQFWNLGQIKAPWVPFLSVSITQNDQTVTLSPFDQSMPGLKMKAQEPDNYVSFVTCVILIPCRVWIPLCCKPGRPCCLQKGWWTMSSLWMPPPSSAPMERSCLWWTRWGNVAPMLKFLVRLVRKS